MKILPTPISRKPSYAIGLLMLIMAPPPLSDRESQANASETVDGMRVETAQFSKKINFVYLNDRKTPNPEGWIEYDGSIYDRNRGYGWLVELSGKGRDRGADAAIELENGTISTPRKLGRLELANWQGRADNLALVFRIDLPDGWYRVTCTSVDPGITSLPLVDRRSFKCRAHDVVFAGSRHGSPLAVGGNDLLEGTAVVEVTEGHLRIVVGEPAYAGWIWTYKGPWYKGWINWFRHDYKYANDWRQKLLRRVDPGFHNMRLNSLEIHRVEPPEVTARVIFRDFFNRDNRRDVSFGLAEADRWIVANGTLENRKDLQTELYQTAIRVSGHDGENGTINLLQRTAIPESGIVRFSTRVSLFTGTGSKKLSGRQEAGILFLVDPKTPTEFNSTFVGVGYDSARRDPAGYLIYRVGDGNEGYAVESEVSDAIIPSKITEGEYEIAVDYDADRKTIAAIRLNGVDVTHRWSDEGLEQRVKNGMFGLRSLIDGNGPILNLRQFYWYYQVDHVDHSNGSRSCQAN